MNPVPVQIGAGAGASRADVGSAAWQVKRGTIMMLKLDHAAVSIISPQSTAVLPYAERNTIAARLQHMQRNTLPPSAATGLRV